MNKKIFFTLSLITYTGISACNQSTMQKMDDNTIENENSTISEEMIDQYEKDADEIHKESDKIRKKIHDHMEKIHKNQSTVSSSDCHKQSDGSLGKFITISKEMIDQYEIEADEAAKKSKEFRGKLPAFIDNNVDKNQEVRFLKGTHNLKGTRKIKK